MEAPESGVEMKEGNDEESGDTLLRLQQLEEVIFKFSAVVPLYSAVLWRHRPLLNIFFYDSLAVEKEGRGNR